MIFIQTLQGQCTIIKIAQTCSMCEKRNMQDRYIEWIKSTLTAKKPAKTQSGLADHLGIAHPQITQMLKGARQFKVDEIPKIAAYLEEPEPPRLVPIKGLVGAGPDQTVLFATGDEDFGEAAAPAGSSLDAVALQVSGDSMRGMADDGWLIFYDEIRDPDPEFYGSPCVCWLADGRVLVKYLQPGGAPDLFDLESTNAETIRDVEVERVALVTNIVPRLAAKKFMKANPNHPVHDVPIEG